MIAFIRSTTTSFRLGLSLDLFEKFAECFLSDPSLVVRFCAGLERDYSGVVDCVVTERHASKLQQPLAHVRQLSVKYPVPLANFLEQRG